MGIYFKPDMATAVEVPNVEAVLLLQRQLRAASLLESGDEREPRRGDVEVPRLTPAELQALLTRSMI
ncbi:MAG TPA: hypothetical protein VMH83_07570 [Candidatus Acidoferrum sp.]|nr:hypothetical protein [Candidatus Acidoferrum sp.]